MDHAFSVEVAPKQLFKFCNLWENTEGFEQTIKIVIQFDTWKNEIRIKWNLSNLIYSIVNLDLCIKQTINNPNIIQKLF